VLNGIYTYTIYYNPEDYPGLYVIRKFVYKGLSICLPREEGDHPSVVETWL
jgi:hypothetical protein